MGSIYIVTYDIYHELHIGNIYTKAQDAQKEVERIEKEKPEGYNIGSAGIVIRTPK